MRIENDKIIEMEEMIYAIKDHTERASICGKAACFAGANNYGTAEIMDFAARNTAEKILKEKLNGILRNVSDEDMDRLRTAIFISHSGLHI